MNCGRLPVVLALVVLASGCAAPAMDPIQLEPELPVIGDWELLGELPGAARVELAVAGGQIFLMFPGDLYGEYTLSSWELASSTFSEIRLFTGFMIVMVGSGDNLYVFIREGPDSYSLIPHIYRYHVPSATWNENRILSEDDGFFDQVHNSARGVSHAGKVFIAGGCCAVANLWEYDTSTFEIHNRGRIDDADTSYRQEIPLVWSIRDQRLIVGPGRLSRDGGSRDMWQSYAPGGVLEPYTVTDKGRVSPVLADESGLWSISNREVSRLEPGTATWHATGLPSYDQDFGIGFEGQLYFAASPSLFHGALWRWTPPKDIPWE